MDEVFTREELQDICLRAENEANSINELHWQRAYRDLADAADKLDAMIIRGIVSTVPSVKAG